MAAPPPVPPEERTIGVYSNKIAGMHSKKPFLGEARGLRPLAIKYFVDADKGGDTSSQLHENYMLFRRIGAGTEFLSEYEVTSPYQKQLHTIAIELQDVLLSLESMIKGEENGQQESKLIYKT